MLLQKKQMLIFYKCFKMHEEMFLQKELDSDLSF